MGKAMVVANGGAGMGGSRSENNKRNSLLQAIHRRGSASRLQLAKALGISNSRVCDLVDEMVGEGLLLEQAVAGDRRGRRGVSVRLNPDFGQLVGFDMEAKRLRMVVTNFAGEVVWQTRRPLKPTEGGEALMGEIYEFLDSAMREVRGRYKKVLGLGLAASGVMDARRGVILHYDLIPHVADIPVRDLVAKRVGLPCVMENNIRAMTLAEWTHGAAKGLESFICMAVRSGVGAGVVLNGRLLSGAHGFCGEVGYMVVPGNGAASGWKQLQQVVSESALGIDVEQNKGAVLPEATARRAGELIGAAVASIAAVVDPEAVVLGGGMLNPDGPVWLHAVSAYRATALPELVENVRLLPAQLGAFGAAVGAAHRCLYELFPVE